MPIDLDKYFERIQYAGPTHVSLETLKAIHVAQAFSIPFENLQMHESQHAHNPANFVKLDSQSLFEKLVIQWRGGYCHENNELLGLVLEQLGFQVERLAARVLLTDNLPETHKLLMITLEGEQWIADVGLASYNLLEPMRLKESEISEQYGHTFQLSQTSHGYRLQLFTQQQWKNLYEFTLQPRQAIDFEPMNYYVSHAPDFLFYTHRICSISTPTRRIVLNNYHLKFLYPTHEEHKTITEAMYPVVLKQYFGIQLNTDITLKPIAPERKKEQAVLPWYSYFSVSEHRLSAQNNSNQMSCVIS